jgi:hypothetical protein
MRRVLWAALTTLAAGTAAAEQPLRLLFFGDKGHHQPAA